MIPQTGFSSPVTRHLYLSVVAYLLLAIFGAAVGEAQTMSSGNEDVKKSLRSGRYPWYDRTTDSANFEAEFSTSKEAKTKSRNNVAKGKASQRTPTAPRTSSGESGLGTAMFIFILVAILALVIGISIWLVLKAEAMENSGNQFEDTDNVAFHSDRIEQLPFNVKDAKGDFLSAAEQAARAGQFSDAMTNLFSHILLTLDKHGKVRLKRGKTNRQYSSELGRNSSLKNYYEQVMVFFESTFFGDHEIKQQQFESCWNALPRFQQDLKQSSTVKND